MLQAKDKTLQMQLSTVLPQCTSGLA